MNTIFKPKFFSLLHAGISKKQISSDIISGVVVGVVAMPLAIAFAVASGVSPERGLITAIIAGFFISFLGGSRVQIGGPTGAFIVIVYNIVEKYGVDGLMISTVLAGLILILFGLLRLGTLLKYFPHPLIVGFTSGIALVIFSTQIKDAFGLDLAEVPSEFLRKWDLYFSHIHTIDPYALLLTLGTILIILISPKVFKKIPGAFVAIVILTPLVALLQLPVATIGTYFGDIPNHLSFVLPNFHFSDLSRYIEPALTIAMLGAIESLLSAVVADGMISGNHRSNTELIAQGLVNILSPFFGGIPATGAIARTATNVKNGGRTPIAGMTHAVVLLLIMLFLGKLAKNIPMSCLAGILIVVAYNMSEWRSFYTILKGSFFDVVILLVTFFLTVLVDLTVAIEVGVVLSALLFMKRMGDLSGKIPHEVDQDVIDDYSRIPEGISIYEISGPLFFASAKQYATTLKELGRYAKILIIRMRHVPFIDETGFHNLHDALDILNDLNVSIVFSGINPHVMKEFEKRKLANSEEAAAFFNSFDEALAYAKQLME